MFDQTNGVNLEKRADDPQSVEGPPTSHLPQYYPARIIPAWTPPESVPENTGTIYWTPNNGNRSCPWYKKMPDTPFTVDAFSFGRIDGCLAYFLTHFHADHYGGLTRQFNHGPVYCSVVTGNLVARQLGVSEDYIVRLPMETPVVVMGVKVTLIDANHCPGAVLFLFELPNGKRYLHTGDFRAHPSHLTHPYLRTLAIHTIYLDTTYCAPAHRFPPQDSVIQAVADMCRRVRNGETVQTIVSGSEKKGGGAHADTEGPAGFLKRWIGWSKKKCSTDSQPHGRSRATLVLVGAYTIGKEKIFHSIAKALGSTIFVEATKRRVLKQLDDPDLMNLLSDDAKSASVHVVKMGALKAADVLPYIMGLGLTPEIVICIRPTGWTFRPTGGKASTVTDAVDESDQATHDAAAAARRALLPVITLGVPYSEHSSFNELESFVKGVGTSVGRVVPTVGQSEAIKGWCDKWLADRKAAAAAAAAALKR
ncbi:DRMBL-domain-containing protein [Powellomyces hirtus]|nr:DRMBL-domain-containing protein [Powellomyces hirtus]